MKSLLWLQAAIEIYIDCVSNIQMHDLLFKKWRALHKTEIACNSVTFFAHL